VKTVQRRSKRTGTVVPSFRQPGSNYDVEIVKLTVIRACVSTGRPFWK